MLFLRGPSSVPFDDDRHSAVDTISLKELITKGRTQFNLTKEGCQRKAIGTLEFKYSDLIPTTVASLDKVTSLAKNSSALLDEKALLEVISGVKRLIEWIHSPNCKCPEVKRQVDEMVLIDEMVLKHYSIARK